MSWKKLLFCQPLRDLKCLFVLLAQIVVQGVLVALQDRQLHALVGPQSIEGVQVVLRHRLFCANVWRRVDHFREAL
jgi:hypothetical protein